MDYQSNPLLHWPYFLQGKSSEELTESLLVTALELETTRVRAQEELKIKDEQLIQLKDLLHKAIIERNEAQEKCHNLFFEKALLQQQQQQQSGVSSIEDEPRRGLHGVDSNNGFSSSDCEQSIVSSPIIKKSSVTSSLIDQEFNQLVPNMPLPENGKFLEAVMNAGPLLKTLLLAGPLPQWRHPPPPIDSYQIPLPPIAIPSPPPPPPPPQLVHQESFLNITAAFSNNNYSINNCCRVNKKRGFCEGSDSSTENKCQRVVPN